MKFQIVSALCLFSAFIAPGCSPSIKNVPGVSYELNEYRKAQLSDIRYQLHLSVPEKQSEAITARLTLSFSLDENSLDLPLDFREDGSKLQELTVNGSRADIIFENEHILLPQDLLTKGSNTIGITFIAGETSLNRNPDYLYTLFVPDRARTAFPLFDQPNLKAVYDLSLELPSSWNAVSNAPLASKTESDSTSLWDFEPSDLISSYLFSFVAGKFEVVTRMVNGYEMTMLHRETDTEKVDRNLDEIFRLHAASLEWLEEYTGIDYPFKKFDFALIPTFQYGGMEHVGAIQYRASGLFLNESPSESQLLGRASLIAHETAHMWFGDLVTMDWFNDVWMKEVFANFMAAKIANPNFPDINHDLNFLLRHYPGAYSVDRTEGANPIRQELPNLNEAGTLYGAIIYQKAPIMMRQLELVVGEETFREGMKEYLTAYSFGNATWPDLIEILDAKTETNLAAWSEVWVSTAGRAEIELEVNPAYFNVVQKDPQHLGRVWPQSFEISFDQGKSFNTYSVLSVDEITGIQTNTTLSESDYEAMYINSNGFGYGLFPADLGVLEKWDDLEDEVLKGSILINLYENLLEGNISPLKYFEYLTGIVQTEENQLLLGTALGHVNTIYWDLFSVEERNRHAAELEHSYWDLMQNQDSPIMKRIFFNSFENVVISPEGLEKLYRVWKKDLVVDKLLLSENDYIGMAATISIKSPGKFEEVTGVQLENINNPDSKRRFEFLIPALSNEQATRDAFFESLKEEKNRQIESWVLSGLGYLHHPLREDESEKYILPSLELLQEIQVTGDIFFPGRWTDVTLGNYSSDSAVNTVRDFLAEHPDYNYQLKLKILQAADMLFRANNIQHQD